MDETEVESGFILMYIFMLKQFDKVVFIVVKTTVGKSFKNSIYYYSSCSMFGTVERRFSNPVNLIMKKELRLRKEFY